MQPSFFKNKKITVFGLGLNGGGVGTVSFLAKQGARLIVTDIKTKKELASSLEKLKNFKNIAFILGQHRPEDFSKVDMVIKNPGVPWSNKHIKMALENNIPVEMDSSLFFKMCSQPIIGVTGTKGKTTTATLIFEILKQAGKRPVKVGVGQESVLDKLESVKKNSVVVFELSSWRLSALGRSGLSPHVAVFTNFMPDHLNYYKSMESYLEDKKQIFRNQKAEDWLVINGDNETLSAISHEAPSRVVKFFSAEPQGGGKLSFFAKEGSIRIRNAGGETAAVPLGEIKIPGAHNVSNVMAAVGAAHVMGVSASMIRKAVSSFQGIPHRLEFVREVKGIRYYNDTAATIPQATTQAMRSFDRPVILIAGGTDKNLDFREFGKEVFQRVKGLIFLAGTATDKMIKIIRENLPEEDKDRSFVVVDSMKKAVELAHLSAEPGDVVLLSPGAASFGLFENEFDRGFKFKKSVADIK